MPPPSLEPGPLEATSWRSDGPANLVVPELEEARANGVVIDSALDRGNFGYEVARRQADPAARADVA